MRHGGLGMRQLGVAAAHSKLDPVVANFMKVLCSQEVYRCCSSIKNSLLSIYACPSVW